MPKVETLEKGTDQKEQAEKVSVTEPEAQVSPGKEEVSKEKTPEDIAAEVKAAAVTKAAADAVEAYKKSDAHAKDIQSSKDKSITQETAPLKSRIAELEKSNATDKLAVKEAKESKQWIDDGIPEETIKSFHAQEQEQSKAGRELTDSITEHIKDLDKLHAWELSEKYGVDMKELLKSKTPEEMDTLAQELIGKAKDGKILSLEAEKKAAEEKSAKTQQIDGDTASAGASFGDLSAEDKLKAGFKKVNK